MCYDAFIVFIERIPQRHEPVFVETFNENVDVLGPPASTEQYRNITRYNRICYILLFQDISEVDKELVQLVQFLLERNVIIREL
jgi:hypothetical protein